ncbi:hypothetical protein GTP58_08945 [Duganella sp. CY15W]|uniref:hypothetical protein n=1 Tax=Duganella sp. CY15W TaxID=2692172 RepID=UPI00136D4ECB|nr:hypothetical protein [Duganella sp. CY15W]MYM28451.1 hypothetical protein [Duganella sp. CY15W]
MTQLTKGCSMRPTLTLLFACSAAVASHAADLPGTWQYETGAAYFGQAGVFLVIKNGKVTG